MTHDRLALTPVIILDGEVNALSVARCLGRRGIPVYAINRRTAHVCYSRYCRRLPVEKCGTPEESWLRYLLGPASDHLRGSVLLTCSDAGLVFLSQHREPLAEKYLLDESNPEAQFRMLDKLATYQSAAAAGIATPRFWVAGSLDDIQQVEDELVFPLILKPLASHLFFERFGRKFVEVNDYPQLLAIYQQVRAAGIDVMLVEKIPGADDQLCSYYTYLDEQGDALFDFTKRVIRRFPPNMGVGCYHITDRIPELREISLRFFRYVGLRGLANVEFKLDARDGQLKLIECNARFTAANCLVAQSGYDLPSLVYDRLTGRPPQPFGDYQSGLRLWYPPEDFWAFRALHRQGELSWWGWLKSLRHRKMTPVFSWQDPLPSIIGGLRRLRRRVKQLPQAVRRTEAAKHGNLTLPNPAGSVTPEIERTADTHEPVAL